MNSEESKDLFRCITEGDLSDEQIEAFKRMKKLSRKWVDNEEDSDDELDDDNYNEEEEDDYDKIFEPQPGTSGMVLIHVTDNADPQPGEVQASQQELNKSFSDKPDRTLALQKEMTNKFLKGELTFTEFTNMLDMSDGEEDDSDECGEQEELHITGPNFDHIYETVEKMKSEINQEDDDEDLTYVDDERDKDYIPSPPKSKRKQPSKSRKIPPKAKSPRAKKLDIGTEKEYMEIEDEMKKWRKKRRGAKRAQNRLPIELQGLVGEANLTFARGEHEEAIKMCMEVIRLAPTSPEPFQTLGMIYEELGDMDKSLQFALISAYLSPNDAEEWTRLAEMSLERGDIKQAITCYGKAIHCDPTNIVFMWTRCRLYEQLGDKKRVLEQMQQISRCLKPEEGEMGFQLARDIAKTLYDNNQISQATTTMERAFEKHQNHITSEDVNLLLELQIRQKLYGRCIRVLCDHCGVEFDLPLPQVSLEDVTRIQDHFITRVKICTVPDVLPIDLCAKLMVCLINLGGSHLLNEIIGRLLHENLEDMGDLYLDVAEAYMGVGMYQEAIPLLAALAASEKYNLAAVWLRYGECFAGLGQLEMSVRAYHQVIEHAPSHVSARMVLSGLLQQLDRPDEALEILKSGYDDENIALEPKLLLKRCSLLYSRGLHMEFIQVAKQLHASHFLRDKLAAHCAASFTGCSNMRRLRELVREYKESAQYPAGKNGAPAFDISTLGNPEEIWDNYLKLVDKLFEFGRFDELVQITKSSLTSTIFSEDPEKSRECDFQRLLACYFNRNFEQAYTFIKHYIFKNVKNNRTWNIFNQIVTMIQDLRHNRFCLRLMFKNPDHIPLGIINGHSALVSGSYKHALGEYMCILKATPKDPLVNLCIGLVFVHMTCQKFSGKKHSLVIQATAFLHRYQELRGVCQETCYNLGRAMHQMGLVPDAVRYYKQGLDCEPAISNTPNCDIFDLRREIAFNLSLIYLASNNRDLAQIYIDRYCVV